MSKRKQAEKKAAVKHGNKALLERAPVPLHADTVEELTHARRMVSVPHEEYLELMREAARGRNLASYILGRTEELKTYGDCRDAVEAVREKCNEEVCRG